ncbi:hypothetical protein [Deinococcus apachensis]|nr:hypothetical protein [Deinococcus apachensis]
MSASEQSLAGLGGEFDVTGVKPGEGQHFLKATVRAAMRSG